MQAYSQQFTTLLKTNYTKFVKRALKLTENFQLVKDFQTVISNGVTVLFVTI